MKNKEELLAAKIKGPELKVNQVLSSKKISPEAKRKVLAALRKHRASKEKTAAVATKTTKPEHKPEPTRDSPEGKELLRIRGILRKAQTELGEGTSVFLVAGSNKYPGIGAEVTKGSARDPYIASHAKLHERWSAQQGYSKWGKKPLPQTGPNRSGPSNVARHTRKLKSGKRVEVKPHTRTRSGSLEDRYPEIILREKTAAIATKTDPAKWEQAKQDAKARMGGKHSARAMQLATQLYQKRGGGYSGKKPTTKNNSLKKWTSQKWQWSGGSKEKTAGSGVYLPEAKIQRLKSTKEGKKKLAAAAAKKAKATREGRQYADHGLAAGTSLSKRAFLERSELLRSVLAKYAANRDPRLQRAGVSGYNKPKRTPNHPTKSHIVVAKEGDRVKTIRFGQQGVRTNQTAGQRKAFKSRHAKNIARGKMSAAYWADRVKWSPSKTKDKRNQRWVKGS